MKTELLEMLSGKVVRYISVVDEDRWVNLLNQLLEGNPDKPTFTTNEDIVSDIIVLNKYPRLADVEIGKDISLKFPDTLVVQISEPFKGETEELRAITSGPLGYAKWVKWNEIKTVRNTEEFGDFPYNGMVFDGDVDSQRRLAGYISVSKTAIQNNTPFTAQFTLADNTEVTLTAEDFVGIEQAKVTQVASVFSIAANLREQINNATSVEAVEIIKWPSEETVEV